MVSIYSFCLFVEDCHRDRSSVRSPCWRSDEGQTLLGLRKIAKIQHTRYPTSPFIPHHHPSPITPAKNLVAPRSAVGPRTT